eukprot:14844903-Alexandrium_andersonii.AAC.1
MSETASRRISPAHNCLKQFRSFGQVRAISGGVGHFSGSFRWLQALSGEARHCLKLPETARNCLKLLEAVSGRAEPAWSCSGH